MARLFTITLAHDEEELASRDVNEDELRKELEGMPVAMEPGDVLQVRRLT